MLPHLSPPVRGLILDMDGVLWKNMTPIGDLGHIFDRMRSDGLKVTLATNNATMTVGQHLDKLAGFGAKLDASQIITSAHATADALARSYPAKGSVFVVGEEGLNAALCGSFSAPVLLVTGDEAVCAEANEWLPGVETVIVKKATGRHSAECLPAKVSQKKIHQGSFQAIRLFNENNAPEPLVIPAPVTVTIEFIYTDMADRAVLLPGVTRLDGRKVEMQAADMQAAYRMFQAAINLASR